MTSTPFGKNQWNIVSQHSGAEKVPVIGMKIIYPLKAYLIQRNYTSYILIHYIIDEHYQSVPKAMTMQQKSNKKIAWN